MEIHSSLTPLVTGNDTLEGGDGADVLLGDVSPGALHIDYSGENNVDYPTLPQFHGDNYLGDGAGEDTWIFKRRHTQYGPAKEMEARL